MKRFLAAGYLSSGLALAVHPAIAQEAAPLAATVLPADGDLSPGTFQETAYPVTEAARETAAPADAACDNCQPPLFDINEFLNSDRPLLDFLRDRELTDDIKWSAGGELRYRYMDERNRLRPAGTIRSTYDLWRITPWLEVGNSKVKGYVQAIDASIFDEDAPPTPIDENRADLLQFYVDFELMSDEAESLRFRYGRQFLSYGSQHLISPLGWANTWRNYEGSRLYYTSPDWNIDAFAVQPVNGATGNSYKPFSADHPDASRWFGGVYTTYKAIENNTFDFYWLWLKENEPRPRPGQAGNAADGNRHTLGARWDGKQPIAECGTVLRTWHWEAEGGFQVGEDTNLAGVEQDVRAGFVSLQLDHTWNAMPWSPNFAGVFWWGSGDDNPGDGHYGTFSTLFPLGHAHWGQIDNFSGQNLLDYSLQATVKPTTKLTLASHFHWFTRPSQSDAVYNIIGAASVPGGTDSHIGNELDLLATYQVNKNLQVQAGYFWFWYGDAVDQSAAVRDDAEQFYLMMTLGF